MYVKCGFFDRGNKLITRGAEVEKCVKSRRSFGGSLLLWKEEKERKARTRNTKKAKKGNKDGRKDEAKGKLTERNKEERRT